MPASVAGAATDREERGCVIRSPHAHAVDRHHRSHAEIADALISTFRQRRRRPVGRLTEKGILGTVGMTQVFDESNRVVPVTVVKVGPNVVTRIRTPERDGYAPRKGSWRDQPTQGHRR